MPFRWNYNRNYWRRRYQYGRRPYRKRFRRNLRKRRYRRRNWVRRRRRKFYKKKKLRKIKITQWQPNHIRKCTITGFYPLFQAAHGRFSNNFTTWRESYTPEYEPGGGGWSAFQFTLDCLYTENQLLNNWWSTSNKGLNLCRFRGVKVKFYRQPEVDYVVTYNNEWPFDMTKYHYMSAHPQRLLTYNHKVIVPSIKTMPTNKKAYYKKFIRPPKELIDEWYFQQKFAKTPLVMFIASACSLQHFYIPNNVESINITVHSLNTKKFQYKDFNTQSTQGYQPQAGYYLYASQNISESASNIAKKDTIYLGNSKNFTEGTTIGKSGQTTVTNYTEKYWGNPFHPDYMLGEIKTIQSSTQYTTLLNNFTTGTLGSTAQYTTEPFYISTRYNPYKDNGVGNKAYWLKNTQRDKGWEHMGDPDLIVEGFPLWILLWGWEDYTRRLAKIHNLNQDYVLVIVTKFFDTNLDYYVLLSEDFIQGNGPYGLPIKEVAPSQLAHWYPQWKFQKQAIEDICKTGPGVCRAETQKQIQAHLEYKFLFKWGGNPATMEKVYNPIQQPTYPRPFGFNAENEIVDPNTSIKDYIYTFDVRRHFLTQTATKRIQQSSTDDFSLFTDGEPTPKMSKFEIPVQTEQTQEESSEEEKTQTPLQQQLEFYKQHNQLLQQRYRQLKTILETVE
nr:MAG: ORF1 [TTV-like mini virus]